MVSFYFTNPNGVEEEVLSSKHGKIYGDLFYLNIEQHKSGNYRITEVVSWSDLNLLIPTTFWTSS